MKQKKDFFKSTLFSTGSFLLIFALHSQTILPAFGSIPNSDRHSRAKIAKPVENPEIPPSEASIIPVADLGIFDGVQNTANGVPSPTTGVDLGEESEPNGTPATADPLTAAEGKIKGSIFPNADQDYYSFTAAAGDRLYAAVQTQTSASASTDGILELFAPDGTTILEGDEDDGSFGTLAPSIANTTLAAGGTYYIRIRHNSATGQLRPYYLYFSLRSGAPVAETEANDTFPGQALPASRWVSGDTSSAADVDFYSLNLNAGETVYLSLDQDPERNGDGNLQLGLAQFGGTVLNVNDSGAGFAPYTAPDSEAYFMTVRSAGSYSISVSVPASAGVPSTYTLSATVFPAASTANCTTYTSTDVPKPIADVALTSSVITVPATTARIQSVRVFLDLNHAFMSDLDIHLRSPAGNDNGFFTDIGNNTTGGPSVMNLWVDDLAAISPGFLVTDGMRYQPELNYRLEWFKGENPTGTWTLDLRDDVAADVGTLNNWSLQVCTEPPVSGQILYSENFEPVGPPPLKEAAPEANDGGYTHSGTQDEWEYGVPNTAATTAANPVAAFLNCNNGSAGCWKTDLDNTYNASSTQDLFSPNLNLTSFSGVIRLEWAMRYQMDTATNDGAFVEVQDVNNPANNRVVWRWSGAVMTDAVGSPVVNIGESAGWGTNLADISDFSGKLIRLRFHLDSGTGTTNFGGLAIDDVLIRGISVVAANVPVGGRVLDSYGRPLAQTIVTLTGADGQPRSVRTNTFGYYRFDGVQVGETYILNAKRRGYAFAPRIVTVQEEITDADLIGFE
jgi:subtilisin-like proprotein convertase family protein